jgi:transcription elongation GreA/GreB family factor
VWGSHWYSDKNGCVQDLLATLDRLKIAPLGADVLPFEWTEHRIVSSKLDSVGAQFEQEEIDDTIATAPLVTAQRSSSEKVRAAISPLSEIELSAAFANGGAKPGDFVVVRYSDNNKLRRILLSATENRPEDDIVHVSQPLGAAVLGADVDDEIEFPQGKGMRSAVIERIERGMTEAVAGASPH